jgi:hypothetical protein
VGRAISERPNENLLAGAEIFSAPVPDARDRDKGVTVVVGVNGWIVDVRIYSQFRRAAKTVLCVVPNRKSLEELCNNAIWLVHGESGSSANGLRVSELKLLTVTELTFIDMGTLARDVFDDKPDAGESRLRTVCQPDPRFVHEGAPVR